MRTLWYCLIFVLPLQNYAQVYVPGQDGIYTVSQVNQWSAQLNLSRISSDIFMNTSLSYSPWKNIGILLNYQTKGNSSNYYNCAVGYYFAKLGKLELSKYRLGKPSIVLGNQFEFYIGTGLGVSNNQEYRTFSSLNSNISYYTVSMLTKRHYIQSGWHKHTKYLTLTAVLRLVWLDVDKIETFGLDADGINNINNSFKNKKYLSILETNIAFKFGGVYKPFIFGYAIKINSATPFEDKTFADFYTFFGFNQEIFNYFRKQKTKTSITP
ncbi:MAG: hypothetical protein IPH93_04075 [Saprospiraceae bacterium]|nr:hypothetical protein [Saprospiraceae bacterium]MBK7811844.1 hypothetical protein [Saprospiraceae bacterium]MBK9631847.1 hypothetical protein [Saprospiraceae bacterium]